MPDKLAFAQQLTSQWDVRATQWFHLLTNEMEANTDKLAAVQAVIFIALLVAVSLWDIRKRIIPDSLCALIFLTGLLTFAPEKLFGVLLGLPLLIAALTQGGGMGGGDIKLTAACGFALGLFSGSAGLILGLTAALFGQLVMRGVRKVKRIPTSAASRIAMPLAPFLSLGFAAVTIINLIGGISI